MKILIVDDHAYNRDLLRFILEDEGFECLEADDGRQACECYQSDTDINIILMDINMPGMDGITATRNIKGMDEERFVPVIFVTALDDSEVIARCLEAGGDDFVPKPVNENVLLAKIKAHSRSQNLYARLQTANQALRYHQQLIDREHALVEHIFKNGNERCKTHCDNIRTYTSPMSMFDGDMVISGPSPNGGVYLMIGDFTGHGLSAAMGSLPVTEMFFHLISVQASLSQIASELNARLYELLPTHMFCCATIAFVDYSGTSMSVWSGGMNDMFCRKPGADGLEQIAAMHMPLGVLAPAEFDDSPRLVTLTPGEKVYMYTDGVNEAVNPAGEEFGFERLKAILLAGGDVVANVTAAVKSFHAGCEQSDDLSIVEFTGGELIHRSADSGEIVDVGADYHNAESFPWTLNMHLEAEDLRKTSIVNQILGFVASIQGIELHQDKIFTIVSELYSNALEHGVLKLSSSLKNSADGFEEYYMLREKRLAEISNDFIDVEFTYVRGEPNRVILVITDSGEGFNFDNIQRKCTADDDMHGRGLNLLCSLCSSLEFSNAGRTVTATYDLCRQ